MSEHVPPAYHCPKILAPTSLYASTCQVCVPGYSTRALEMSSILVILLADIRRSSKVILYIDKIACCSLSCGVRAPTVGLILKGEMTRLKMTHRSFHRALEWTLLQLCL